MNDTIRRSLRTFIQVFVGVFAITMLGFIGDVARWAGSAHAAFPSMSPLAKGAVAALCAAGATLVTFLQNWAEDKSGASLLAIAGKNVLISRTPPVADDTEGPSPEPAPLTPATSNYQWEIRTSTDGGNTWATTASAGEPPSGTSAP